MKHLVVTVHGIRTFGDWQERLEQLLKSATKDDSLTVLNYKYGYFSIIAFLIPPIRWLVVRRFRKAFIEQAKSSTWDRIDLVAHSFGTHLIGWGLHSIPKDKRPRIHTIILAGSVLKPAFPWLDLTEFCVHRLVNDCGIHDRVLILNQVVVLFTGMAGRVGFAGMTGNNFRNRFFSFGHSGYFVGKTGPDDSFMREKWLPLLLGNFTIVTFPDPRHSSAFSGLVAFVLNNIEPIKVAVYVLPVLALVLFYRSLYLNAARARDHARATLSQSYFLQGLRSINEGNDPNALAQLAASFSSNRNNQAAVYRLTTLLAYRVYAIPLIRLGHDGIVASAQFSPDGKRIVTASMDKTARVWDADTGKPLTEPMRHDGEVSAAQFSADGKRIVTRSSDAAQVWDAETGKALIEPISAGKSLVSAQFTPDGKRILTASHAEKTARIWDVETGKPLTKPMEAGRTLYSAEFSPDGKRILTASYDRVRVWDARTGEILAESATLDAVYWAKFSPNGKQFVTGSGHNTAQVWDAETSKPLTEPMRHQGRVNSAQFSPDGKRIVTQSSDSSAQVWDAETGKALTEPMKHEGLVISAQFSLDGERIVTASLDTARIWNARTGEALTEPMKHAGWVLSAQFSPDGKRVVTSSKTNTVRIWDVRTGICLTQPMKHRDLVNTARFSPDGKRVVTASQDNTAQVWDTATQKPLAGPMKHGNGVVSAQFSPDGRRIVTASYDSTARVWDSETGKQTTTISHDRVVDSAQFSPDGKRIVTRSSGAAQIWNAETGQSLIDPIKHYPFVRSALFSPDGRQLLTASGNEARIWDCKTGKETKAIKHDNILHAEFSPDGKRIVTASANFTAQVWDVATGKSLIEPMWHDGFVDSAQFSPDGNCIITASSDHTARIWDAKTGQPLTEPMKHNDFVKSAQLSSDGKYIVTTSPSEAGVWFEVTGEPLPRPDGIRAMPKSGCEARVWDVSTGQPLTDPIKHDGFLRSGRFSPGGNQILTASRNEARIWDLVPAARPPEWLPRLAEAIAGEDLSDQGMFESPKTDPIELLEKIKDQLSREPEDDEWAIWGRWFLADRSTRTISPFSKVTVPEYIENRITENTAESLGEAEKLAIGSQTLLDRIARVHDPRRFKAEEEKQK